jgi:hypothetical protein
MERKAREQPSTETLVSMADRKAYWRLQIALWQQSGLSVRSFCQRQKLYEPGFRLWRRAVCTDSRASAAPTGGESQTVRSSPQQSSRSQVKCSATAERLENLEQEIAQLKQHLATMERS